MRRLLTVEVADLEQDNRLHELLNNQDCVIQLTAELDCISDHDDELKNDQQDQDLSLDFR